MMWVILSIFVSLAGAEEPAPAVPQSAVEKVLEGQQEQQPVPVEAPKPVSPPITASDISITLDDLLKIRDPFRRVIKVDEKSDTRTLSELEQFPIEEFKMVGVITGPKRIRAMLRSPNGGTHFVAINQKVGTRNGRVVRITSDYVEVVEKISNILGRTETVTQKIEISPEFQTQ
jgi:hypothetical protein